MSAQPKEKKKKSRKYALNIWQFLLIWIVAHLAVLLTVWWILNSMGRFNPLEAINAIMMGLGMGVPIAIVQYQLIRRLMMVDLRFWISISALGWLMSGIALFVTSTEVPVEISIQILMFFLIPTVLQFLILRRYIQNAWLWILANAIGSIVLALPITSSRSLEVMVLTAGGILQTVTTGIVLYWLFRQVDLYPIEWAQKMSDIIGKRQVDEKEK